MVHQSNLSKRTHNMMSAEQRRLLAIQLKKQSQDLSDYLFNKVESCFNQLQVQFTNTIRMVAEMGGKGKSVSKVKLHYAPETFKM